MKRILLIVVWFFVFTFLGFVGWFIGVIALDAAGLKPASEHFLEKILRILFIAEMVLGLALGLYGLLPGTKQKTAKLLIANKGIQYLILRFGLVFVFLLFTSPIAAIFVWLTQFQTFDWIVYPLSVVYLIGLPWFANKVAERMAFDGCNMFVAVKSTLCDLRLRFSFLPVIGSWFISDSDEHDSDRDDNK